VLPPLHATLVCDCVASNVTVAFTVATAVPQLLLIKYDTVVVPADSPVKLPDASIVPTAVLELLHDPPDAVLLSVVLVPTDREVVPDMADTVGVTNTLRVKKVLKVPQPVAV
jgi:hypothetical protein